MGDEQSKPEAPANHTGPKPDMAANSSASQVAFGNSFKCTKRDSWPLWDLSAALGQEVKYMDTRVDAGFTNLFDGRVHFEIFFSGELTAVDQDKLRALVEAELGKYGAVIATQWREAGCMISMIAIPFHVTEEEALRLGDAMFSDFLSPPADAK